MPFGLGPSVIYWNGCCYWRTWFIEECEREELFGATQGHLGILTLSTGGNQPYQEGTLLYIEDAPYFKKTGTHHRICGPYSVYSKDNLPPGAEPIHTVNGKVIIYRDPMPQKGPWLDRQRLTRIIDGIKVSYPQIASRFEYFPYRFGIRKAKKYSTRHIQHTPDCWLCK
jgi:hypothetical protein